MEGSSLGSYLNEGHLKEFFTEQGVDETLYRSLCHDVEYRTGLIQHLLPAKETGFGDANMGEFVHPRFWRPDAELTLDQWENVPLAERRFREDYLRRTAAVWSQWFGERSLDEVLTENRNVVKKYQRCR